MLRVLVVFGTLALVGILGFVSLFGYLAYKGTQYDKESKMWVDTEIPKIISNWDAKELVGHSSPELLTLMSEDQAIKFMRTSHDGLGQMTKYVGSTGESGIHINNGSKIITAEYLTKAAFEKGDAEIEIRLIRENGVWKILNFDIHNLSKSRK